MEEMLNRYLLAFDEINALTAVSYVQATGSLQERIEKITDDVLALLIKAYKHGADDIEEMLEFSFVTNRSEMYDAIFQKIEGKTFEDRVATHVEANDANALKALVESEYHRVYIQATLDGANRFQASESKGQVMKTWRTVGDDRVRGTHLYLEDERVPLNAKFYTYDGDSATGPGNFENPENNVNCRCWLTYTNDV